VGEWPHVQQRHEMFEEALQIIRALLAGETLSYTGNHYEVPEAYLWDRPERAVPMAVAVSGPSACSLAAEYGDACVATQPESRLLQMFDEAGGTGKPRYGQVAVCYGPDEAECRKIAYDQFRWFGLPWKVNSELPGPESFAGATQFVREEDVAQGIPCGPDVEAHVAAFKKFVDAGFTHVALVQIGGDTQPEFLEWARDHLVPRLREL
jgi:G6PDH family F420-dependent oxidoreductase